MLKTNCKQARENIRNYIVNNYDASGYDVNQEATDFTEIANIILDTFKDEMSWRLRRGENQQQAFVDWCQGLPSILNTCYYYNRSAVADVATILEETAEEASRYSEQVAEQLLTWLIYRELMRVCHV